MLAERPAQRGRQEQEVLRSQGQTHVRAGSWILAGGEGGGGVTSPPRKRTLVCVRWAKDLRVVLVSSHERKKWTTVRPLPTKKPIPSQFEVFSQPGLIGSTRPRPLDVDPVSFPQICMHVTAGKKCQYVGNCTFAHSVEERDLWTYMKENNSEFRQERRRRPVQPLTRPPPGVVADMDQLYEQWLGSQRPGWGEDSSSNSVRENGKQIHMPTDYAEEVVSRRDGGSMREGHG